MARSLILFSLCLFSCPALSQQAVNLSLTIPATCVTPDIWLGGPEPAAGGAAVPRGALFEVVARVGCVGPGQL